MNTLRKAWVVAGAVVGGAVIAFIMLQIGPNPIVEAPGWAVTLVPAILLAVILVIALYTN